MIRKGLQASDSAATVVDTRSGAVAYLREYVTGADSGIIAVHLGSMAGVVRSDALQPLAC